MAYACFLSSAEAQRHRSQHGGWIFETTTGQYFWFALWYTASKVMTHPALRGYEGRLA